MSRRSTDLGMLHRRLKLIRTLWGRISVSLRGKVDYPLKIAVLNGLTYLATTAGVTHVDGGLVSHVTYGARSYPLGYWICLFAFPVFTLSLLAGRMARTWRWKAALPHITLAVAGGISLWNFLPELPHAGVAGWLLCYVLIGLFGSWIHHVPFRVAWIKRDIPWQLKLERAKEMVTLWRMIALSTVFGYVAIVVPWCNFIWTQAASIVKRQEDVFALSSFGIAQVAIATVYVILGPVAETFKKAHDAAGYMLDIPVPRGPAVRDLGPCAPVEASGSLVAVQAAPRSGPVDDAAYSS